MFFSLYITPPRLASFSGLQSDRSLQEHCSVPLAAGRDVGGYQRRPGSRVSVARTGLATFRNL